MQLTFALGTGPFVVGEEKVQVTVRTVVPSGWSTVMVALVNAMSVMTSVHWRFGQSGAPSTGVTGGWVTTLNVRLPFLISSSGILIEPVTSTSAGSVPEVGSVLTDSCR